MRVLVIEDDLPIAREITKFLAGAGLTIQIASDGEAGEFLAATEEYDAIILDVNLPKMDGWQVLKSLRRQKVQTPVLILTVQSKTAEKVKGLNLGADDYLPKPFEMQELLARVQALIRRASVETSPAIQVADLIIEPLAHKVEKGGQVIELSAKEFAVLEYLARNRGHVVTRTMILEHVWGDEFATFSNVVDVYIKNLRQKLDPDSQVIKTIRGKGYILDETKA